MRWVLWSLIILISVLSSYQQKISICRNIEDCVQQYLRHNHRHIKKYDGGSKLKEKELAYTKFLESLIQYGVPVHPAALIKAKKGVSPQTKRRGKMTMTTDDPSSSERSDSAAESKSAPESAPNSESVPNSESDAAKNSESERSSSSETDSPLETTTQDTYSTRKSTTVCPWCVPGDVNKRKTITTTERNRYKPGDLTFPPIEISDDSDKSDNSDNSDNSHNSDNSDNSVNSDNSDNNDDSEDTTTTMMTTPYTVYKKVMLTTTMEMFTRSRLFPSNSGYQQILDRPPSVKIAEYLQSRNSIRKGPNKYKEYSSFLEELERDGVHVYTSRADTDNHSKRNTTKKKSKHIFLNSNINVNGYHTSSGDISESKSESHYSKGTESESHPKSETGSNSHETSDYESKSQLNTQSFENSELASEIISGSGSNSATKSESHISESHAYSESDVPESEVGSNSESNPESASSSYSESGSYSESVSNSESRDPIVFPVTTIRYNTTPATLKRASSRKFKRYKVTFRARLKHFGHENNWYYFKQ
ncbi:dentin sialophosphoprotein-like [Trichoplusia ni]|uniref:Dentin sialophosphoprotein-like n=1 Tax=Trichoplusia ni TaxID=7111 RepID=A0A7E5X530_TRINI|nr:dentin sialophosphoprotein-like [Trichoplusia ni]